ncbi:MAG: ABC transporter permease [Acidimicrobiales bacterium]
MGTTIIRRVLFAVLAIFLAITFDFFLFRAAPGSALTDLARLRNTTAATTHALSVEFGLNKSVWQQYLSYLGQLAHGNMGLSYDNEQPVLSNLLLAIGDTLPMVALGTAVALAVGIVAGIVSAWRRGGLADQLGTGAALGLYSVPTQWLGLMLVIAFAGILPGGGRTNQFLVAPGFWQHVGDVLTHMILPSLTLALSLCGGYILIVRSSVLATLREDYILTARAKGLSSRAVLRRHALPNAMLPLVTVTALSLGYLVTGTILIETVFSWPGIGMAIYVALTDRDYPMLQGAFLIFTTSVVVCNLAADLLYMRLDPRVGHR